MTTIQLTVNLASRIIIYILYVVFSTCIFHFLYFERNKDCYYCYCLIETFPITTTKSYNYYCPIRKSVYRQGDMSCSFTSFLRILPLHPWDVLAVKQFPKPLPVVWSRLGPVCIVWVKSLFRRHCILPTFFHIPNSLLSKSVSSYPAVNIQNKQNSLFWCLHHVLEYEMG